MPVRLVCPSCSAPLSVKDEYAGRAVKCPKCGGVIPASQPGAAPPPAPSKAAAPALPPEPESEPARSPFEALDEPAKPKAKITGKPTGKPAPKSDADDLPDADEDAKPAKRKGRDDERPVRAKRGREDEEDDEDRPRGKKRKGDDEDDGDDRSGGKKKKGGSNIAIILIVVGGGLLLCCGGISYGIYSFVNQVKEGVQNELNPKNDKVTFANYEKVKHGMTRSEVEGIMGTGKLATREKLVWISNGAEFAQTPNVFTQSREETWSAKINQGRVYIWQNDTDAAVFGFHPDGGPNARVQMREFISKTGKNDLELGIYRDDAAFVRKFGGGTKGGAPIDLPEKPAVKLPIDPPGKPKDKVDPGEAIEITARALADAYQANERTADAKYKGKRLTVTGLLFARFQTGDQHSVLLGGGVTGVIKVGAENGADTALRGQKVRLTGRCDGNAGTIVLLDCAVLSVTPAEFLVVTADKLFADFVKNTKEAEKKYANVGAAEDTFRYLHVTNARVGAVGPGYIDLIAPTVKGTKLQLRAHYLTEDARPFADLKVGDPVSVKGQSYFSGENYWSIDFATVAP